MNFFRRYGVQDNSSVIMFWLKILTDQPNWDSDKHALYLIDYLCQEAFFATDIYTQFKGFFKTLINVSGLFCTSLISLS